MLRGNHNPRLDVSKESGAYVKVAKLMTDCLANIKAVTSTCSEQCFISALETELMPAYNIFLKEMHWR